jgi:hypothetical protein
MANQKCITALLAHYGAELKFAYLPDKVIDHAKLLILDTVLVNILYTESCV